MSEPHSNLSSLNGFSNERAENIDHSFNSPRYPVSTEKLIMDYHRAHSNSFRLGYNIGPGSGIFVPQLAQYFQHVHISNPDIRRVHKLRDELSKWYAENWWQAKLTFSATSSESAAECVVAGSVDLTTVMMFAHRTDVEAMVRSVAESLAPNGTLAVVQHSPFGTVVDNDAVNDSVQDLFKALGAAMVQLCDGEDLAPAVRELTHLDSGLDYVNLPDGLFIQDVTKMEINPRGRNETSRVVPNQEQQTAPSRVHPDHRRYNFSHPDKEAEGWRHVVDAHWFRAFIGTFGPLNEQSEEQLTKIEQAIRDTSPGQTVLMKSTASILLATRK